MPGRPSIWTTPDFLRAFRLSSLKELPPAEQFLDLASILEAVQIALPIEDTSKHLSQNTVCDDNGDGQETKNRYMDETNMDAGHTDSQMRVNATCGYKP